MYARVRNNNGILSAIDGQQWYQDLFSQQLHVAYSINAGHLFNDGNKRTCFLVIKDLSKFGYYFNDDLLVDAILELACSKINKDKFILRVNPFPCAVIDAVEGFKYLLEKVIKQRIL